MYTKKEHRRRKQCMLAAGASCGSLGMSASVQVAIEESKSMGLERRKASTHFVAGDTVHTPDNGKGKVLTVFKTGSVEVSFSGRKKAKMYASNLLEKAKAEE